MPEYEEFYEKRLKAEAESAAPEEESAERGPMDLPFLLLTLLILGIGLIVVLSASFARAYYESGDPTKYFVRQALFSISGIMIMLFISRLRVDFIRRISLPALVVTLLLLAAVPFVGETEGGATRWINLGITSFQPSEAVKFAVILSFAALACKFKGRMKTFKYGVLPFGVILLAIVIMLMLEPHISASVIIIGIGAIMMFLGGTKLGWFGLGVGLVALAGVLVMTKMDYAMARINIWRDPFIDPLGDGFQTIQSLYAIGSGGLLGVGLGQSRQKYMYLPEEHNDYIFSVACEELGYIGAMLILALFAILIIRGFWLAVHAKNRYGTMVTAGITALLFIQVFLNVAVVTNLVPCTGISLPFFSYGGTALWIQLAEMGVVLCVSRDIPAKKEG